MIENQTQYEITKSQLAKLQAAMQQMDESGEQDIHPLLQKAQRDGLQSQIDGLSEQIREFESRLDELPF